MDCGEAIYISDHKVLGSVCSEYNHCFCATITTSYSQSLKASSTGIQPNFVLLKTRFAHAGPGD